MVVVNRGVGVVGRNSVVNIIISKPESKCLEQKTIMTAFVVRKKRDSKKKIFVQVVAVRIAQSGGETLPRFLKSFNLYKDDRERFSCPLYFM
jgi:hypothetical protein